VGVETLPRLFAVLVKTLAGLEPQFLFVYQFLDRLVGNKERIVGEFLLPTHQDRIRSVMTDVIGQFDWSHWVTRAQFHRGVDVSRGGISCKTRKQ
jgi:hypothetical protein